MKIAGLQKTTLLDYPGKVACTVFLSGCNFRCPFCQNAEILDGSVSDLSEEEFFAFLQKRRGLLDGVCVSGGEPLVHADIGTFLGKIKALGYAVKADTNGAFPDRLQALCEQGLVDYVAMDIKNSPEKYEKTAGVPVSMEKIKKSAAFLMEGGCDYEFRTTVVKQLHRPEDMLRIAQWLQGAKRYFLQNFRVADTVLQRGLTPLCDEELEAFKRLMRPFIPAVRIRGEQG